MTLKPAIREALLWLVASSVCTFAYAGSVPVGPPTAKTSTQVGLCGELNGVWVLGAGHLCYKGTRQESRTGVEGRSQAKFKHESGLGSKQPRGTVRWSVVQTACCCLL